MILLAIDTTGKNGSVALARVERGGDCNPIEVVVLAGGTFSAQMVPQIAELLAKHGFSRPEIEAFAVASGPGSFTGLRVGLSAIKALAEVLHKPIAAVSLLEAVAVASGREGILLAGLDASRKEIYAGEYEVSGGVASLVQERLLTAEEFVAFARGRTVITPDGTVAAVARAAGLTVVEIERPRSDWIAKLGWKKIQAGLTVSAEALDANYIRHTDAEIFSKPGAR